eukprot:Seg485.3 transcript_id=Seg485.3/GoldUCD/mRNA.D3Y31 product="hypothetical protein" protein_id=Seg485.3/GoldUCD/D3Y31
MSCAEKSRPKYLNFLNHFVVYKKQNALHRFSGFFSKHVGRFTAVKGTAEEKTIKAVLVSSCVEGILTTKKIPNRLIPPEFGERIEILTDR